MIFITIVVAINSLARISVAFQPSMNPGFIADRLDIAEIISNMEHDFLLEVVAPLASRHVPAGMSIDLRATEDMQWVLRRFSVYDWNVMLSHIDGDYLVHIMQLLEALP